MEKTLPRYTEYTIQCAIVNRLDFRSPSSLLLGPDGLFLPASQASTVRVDTPNHFANKDCVSPVLERISLKKASQEVFSLCDAQFLPMQINPFMREPASLSEEIPDSYTAADAFLFSCVAGDADVHAPGGCFCGLHAEAEFSEEARALDAGGAEPCSRKPPKNLPQEIRGGLCHPAGPRRWMIVGKFLPRLGKHGKIKAGKEYSGV